MSSGYQFVHVNAYSDARPAARTRGGKLTGTSERKWNVSDVLAEADRDPAACRHVEHPEPPNWLHGTRQAVEAAGAAWRAGTQRESKKGPRAVRSDSPWLAAGVVSLPHERRHEWTAFRDDVLTHLEAKYGQRLVAVVEHLDEEHPHLHFYAVPRPGEDFGAVHEGYAAKTAARTAGESGTGLAFVAAMKSFQDAFHDVVGRPWGLARVGPRRERLKRAEWQLRQAEALASAAAAKVDVAEAKARDADLRAAAALRDAAVEVAAVKAQGKSVAASYFKKAKAQVEAAQAEIVAAWAQVESDRKALEAAAQFVMHDNVHLMLDGFRGALVRVEAMLKRGEGAKALALLESVKQKLPPDLRETFGAGPAKPKRR